MHEWDDHALLREYVERDSEEAFAILVTRHVNQVYSVALRQTGNPHAAEEITQAVFVILARKSRRLGPRVILSGWLYQTARLTAVTLVRGEIRRARREQEAHMQTVVNESESAAEIWPHIAPLLETAMAQLNANDRHAVVLRFFDGKSLKEVGASLGANEEAAKKRVQRALDKLRRFFTQRGVRLSATVLTAALGANAVHAAPATLAKTVTAMALTHGATASGSTLTLIKGALKLMAWTKAKTAVVAGLVVVLTTGTTTVIVEKNAAAHRQADYESLFHPDGSRFKRLEQTAPVLIVRPTRYPNGGEGVWTGSGKGVYTDAGITELIAWAYDINPVREILPTDAPRGNYDYLNTRPNPTQALREELKKQFRLDAHRETRPTDVVLLQAGNPGKLNSFRTRGGAFACYGTGEANTQKRIFNNAPLSLLAEQMIEPYFNKPCDCRTDAEARYDFEIQWQEPLGLTGEAHRLALQPVIEAQLNQLGLELVPTREPIEMLVVESAK